MHDLHARPVRLDDERRDLLARFAVFADCIRCARHHDEQLGSRPVGAPELLAIQDERFSVLRWRGRGVHVRGVAPRIHFSQRERGDRTLREAREEAAFLLIGAEQLEWLRKTNRLMR